MPANRKIQAKSVLLPGLPSKLQPLAMQQAINAGFSEREARNSVWYAYGDDHRIYGYSESRIYKVWTTINRKPIL